MTVVPKKMKPSLNMYINTEEINNQFKVGEKGDEYILKNDTNDLESIYLQELDEIASICIAAMKRLSANEDI